MSRRRLNSNHCAALGMALVIVSGCASTGARVGSVVERRPVEGATAGTLGMGAGHTEAMAPGLMIATEARAMLGVPYKYGGTDPANGFDCSGLVYYTYATAGIDAPRTSQGQFRAARKISINDAEAGDLIFFQDQEKLSHVGIYLGDDLFVHAPSSGKSVSIASLNAPYYQRQLVAVGRLLSQ